ncbi:MAG: alpha/beta hydrolase [Pelagimonas sp.]|jgi:acetyl esterase/lipase|nr:alpha/beta hydrolase [Pelagimonas sp.]
MSWQLRLLTVQLRLIIKRRLSRVGTPQRVRADLDFAARACFRPTPHLRHDLSQGNLHWFRVGRCAPGRVILYFHGGGYVAGSPMTHAQMLGRMSKLSGIEICAPQYPRAPDAPFPAQFDAGLQAWDTLMTLGYAPKDVVLGGDSAGGGLALSVLSHLCQQGRPPAALFAMSPWTDLTMSAESLRLNRDADPLLPASRIEELVDYVVPPQARADPRISPLFADFPNCPPVHLHYSETEILRDDSSRMVDHLQAQGAQVHAHTHPNAPHVWHLFDGWIPEARDSLRDLARFSQAAFNRSDTNR